MRRSRRSSRYLGLWMMASFLAGALAGMLLMAGFRIGERSRQAEPGLPFMDSAKPAGSGPRIDSPPTNDVAPARGESGARVERAPAQAASPPPDIDDAVDELRDRDLLVPVQGVTRDALRDSFKEAREKIREHEAVDILAARRTPVVAVEDGTIVKFFTSVRGGITIYQFDSSQTFAYYYAHLDGYAPGLSEGDRVARGQTIGFVGTTGNAPPNTPHLHFAIFLLTEKKEWWQGVAINPYNVWKK